MKAGDDSRGLRGGWGRVFLLVSSAGMIPPVGEGVVEGVGS